MKKCLREPIAEIYEASVRLRRAVDAHLAGDRDAAKHWFAAADMSEVRDWTESIWGKGWAQLVQPRVIANAPPSLPKASRVPVRMPNRAESAALIERDGYHCRFCGIPVIPKDVRAKAVRLYSSAVTWGSTNLSQHAAFQCMWLQFDHLVPHARGGGNEPTNVVITCAPCNYGRFNFTIEELDLENPFNRNPAPSTWNGLIDFLKS
jgi:5-methylcytosine-specific restriction endonuclease McrA